MPKTPLHARPLLSGAAASTFLAICCLSLLLAAPAWAGGNAITGEPTPFADISSAGPLEDVYVGDDLSCQIRRGGALQVYSGIPGDCGTFASYGGVLYMPDFEDHEGESEEEELEESSTSYDPLAAVTQEEVEAQPAGEHNEAYKAISQTPVTGAGTVEEPFTVTTVVDAGAKLRLTETDSYVVGNDYYTVSVEAENRSEEPLEVTMYRGQDCFLGGSDKGFGWVNGMTPACTTSANNEPTGFIEALVPATFPAANYLETEYAANWRAIGTRQALPDSCDCETFEDNGDSVSWQLSIPAGQTEAVAVTHVFSANGEVPEPPPAPSKPIVTTAPVLPEESAPQAGAAVTAEPGSAEGAEGYEYQWQLCETSEVGSCVDIAGANGTQFTPGAGEVGMYLRFVVTAFNEAGTTASTSPLIGPIGAGATGPAPGGGQLTAVTTTTLGATSTTGAVSPPSLCRSSRAETIHWKATRGMRLKRIVVTVNGKVKRHLPGGARKVRVDLAGRSKGAVTISIVGTSREGKRYGTSRRYQLCVPSSGHERLERSQYLRNAR
jgi:hypothetical protein